MNAMKMKNKVEKLRWQMNGNGGFEGRFSVNRKPFGEFTVEVNIGVKDGMTGVIVKHEKYGGLYWSATCAKLEDAIEKLEDRFEHIGELAERMQKRYDEIMDQSRQAMSKAIQEALAMQDLNKEWEGKENV